MRSPLTIKNQQVQLLLKSDQKKVFHSVEKKVHYSRAVRSKINENLPNRCTKSSGNYQMSAMLLET